MRNEITVPMRELESGPSRWLRSNLEAALQQYSRALELRPGLVDARIALGKVLTAMGQPQKALGHLLDAAHMEPQNDVARYRLALAYRKLVHRTVSSLLYKFRGVEPI